MHKLLSAAPPIGAEIWSSEKVDLGGYNCSIAPLNLCS